VIDPPFEVVSVTDYSVYEAVDPDGVTVST
jgi:hypothetical protein